MPTITTKSNKTGRELTVEMPEILKAENLAELVEIQGEEATFTQAKGQLIISFRSTIRGALERVKKEEGKPDVPFYTDEQLEALDFTDWKPSGKTRQSGEEKAIKALGNLSAEDRAKVLAKYAEMMAAAGMDEEADEE